MTEKKFLYSDKVKEHFLNPKNFITDKETEKWNNQADGIGEVGSPACGDVMKVWIKVENNKITECKWQTYGCASAIASTSIMSEMAIGMTLEEAEKLTAKEISEKLGGLPQIKVHCSVLGKDALKAAIKNFKLKQKGEKMEEGKITKETVIGEAIRLCPKAAELLMEKGMHCPACPMAAMETLETGLKAHGKSDEEIEEIIKKINELKE